MLLPPSPLFPSLCAPEHTIYTAWQRTKMVTIFLTVTLVSHRYNPQVMLLKSFMCTLYIVQYILHKCIQILYSKPYSFYSRREKSLGSQEKEQSILSPKNSCMTCCGLQRHNIHYRVACMVRKSCIRFLC